MLTYGVTKLFVGYTFTDAKAGIEAYYSSRQTLNDRSLTRYTEGRVLNGGVKIRF